jgi:hypothetical protein
VEVNSEDDDNLSGIAQACPTWKYPPSTLPRALEQGLDRLWRGVARVLKAAPLWATVRLGWRR